MKGFFCLMLQLLPYFRVWNLTQVKYIWADIDGNVYIRLSKKTLRSCLHFIIFGCISPIWFVIWSVSSILFCFPWTFKPSPTQYSYYIYLYLYDFPSLLYTVASSFSIWDFETCWILFSFKF
jgi:hypothetical protein